MILVWFLVVAPAPFFVLVRCLLAKRKSGREICVSSLCCLVLFVFVFSMDLPRCMKPRRFIPLQFISPLTPAHRKPPWTGYKQSLRLFTQLITAPLTGICRPPNLPTAESNRLTEQLGVGLSIRGHSAGSYAGMVWEEILAEFPNFIGTTVLAAVAFLPNYMTQPKRSGKRQLHLIHHAEDRLYGTHPGLT